MSNAKSRPRLANIDDKDSWVYVALKSRVFAAPQGIIFTPIVTYTAAAGVHCKNICMPVSRICCGEFSIF